MRPLSENFLSKKAGLLKIKESWGTFFFYNPAINAWLKVKCVPLIFFSQKRRIFKTYVEYINQYQIPNSHPITFLFLFINQKGHIKAKWGTFFFCIPAFMHDEK